MLVKESLEVECRKFYVLSANIEAHGHMGSCLGYALLTVHGESDKSGRRSQDGNTQGQYRWRESESEGGKELELSEVQVMCLRNPWIEMMRRWRFDLLTHLAVTCWRTNTKRKE